MSVHAWNGSEGIDRRVRKQLCDSLLDEYYEHSDFHHIGYWYDDTASQVEACENLMRILIELVPERDGAVLEAMCGKGATTRTLTEHFPAAAITAIDMSEARVDRARDNAPGCRVLLMDATALDFDDDSFDTVISVEAAFLLRTRERFLEEVVRVLRPGGRLVMADILKRRRAAEPGSALAPEENEIGGIDDYHNLLVSVGFTAISILDATERCADSYRRHLMEFARRKLEAGEIDRRRFMRIQFAVKFSAQAHSIYALVSARKPADATEAIRR